jgi:beta-phosphoglucomutase-like phosphatase (HAD superfamily)
VLTRAGGSEPAPELLERAISLYHEVYWRTCAVEVSLVPGISGVLRAPGVRRALLTNKARRYTEKILATVGLDGCFEALVAGDDPGARLKPDPWPVQEALRRLGEPPAHAILVGDTESDVGAGAGDVVRGLGRGARAAPGGRGGSRTSAVSPQPVCRIAAGERTYWYVGCERYRSPQSGRSTATQPP